VDILTHQDPGRSYGVRQGGGGGEHRKEKKRVYVCTNIKREIRERFVTKLDSISIDCGN